MSLQGSHSPPLIPLLREQLIRISLQASLSVALKGSSNMVCHLEVPGKEGRERMSKSSIAT